MVGEKENELFSSSYSPDPSLASSLPPPSSLPPSLPPSLPLSLPPPPHLQAGVALVLQQDLNHTHVALVHGHVERRRLAPVPGIEVHPVPGQEVENVWLIPKAGVVDRPVPILVRGGGGGGGGGGEGGREGRREGGRKEGGREGEREGEREEGREREKKGGRGCSLLLAVCAVPQRVW